MMDSEFKTQIKAAIDEMNGALVSRETSVLERIFAEGYIFTTPIGTQQRIESMRSGQRAISSIEFPDLAIQVYGTTAVATSRYIEVVEPQHTPQEGRITNVFILIDGRWQMVAGHSFSKAVTQSGAGQPN